MIDQPTRSTFPEIRRHKRHVVSGLDCNMLYESDINVLNISEGGIAVETDMVMLPQREYTLTVRHGEKSLSVKGRVVWSMITRNKRLSGMKFSPVFHSGIKFRGLMDGNTRRLSRIIDITSVRSY